MTNQKHMVWLQNMIAFCQQIFNLFNWGANYEKFREATAMWRLTLSNLVNFSDTRFVNSKRKVLLNINHEFAPIISFLDDEIDAGVRNRSGLEKNTRNKSLRRHILVASFLRHLVAEWQSSRL